MWDVRPITADETEAFRRQIPAGFGRDAGDDDESRRRFDAIFELERTLGAFDGDELVGTAAALSHELTVPGGGLVPSGGTTVVTVRPTHRRQGLLRAMMSAHLDEVAGRGEPLASLWASESSIYGRFGYGIATHNLEISFDAARVEFRDETAGEGRIRLIDDKEAGDVLPAVYDRLRPRLPGMLSRSQAWWDHRVLADPEEWRDGKSANRHVVYEREGEPLGYLTYRQKAAWEHNLPNGEVSIEEVITIDDEAHTGLWRFVANIDLFPRVEYWNLPIDDPLPYKLTDSRRVKRDYTECLWVRVMDVPVALAARRYAEDASITFTIRDESRPETADTYRLDVTSGVGVCEPSAAEADVAMDVDVLGHLYLGGGDAIMMARAGRIDGDAAAVTKLHRLFRGDVVPWCPEVF